MRKDVCRFLHPYLCKGVKPSAKLEFTQTYRTFQRRCYASNPPADSQRVSLTVDHQKRLKQLERNGRLMRMHPPLGTLLGGPHYLSVPQFNAWARSSDIPYSAGVTKQVIGRVQTVRTAGSKLVFFDLVYREEKVQGMCNFRILEENGVSREQWQHFKRLIRKGDWFAINGQITKTSTGELSILASQLPQILSPSEHQIPETLVDPETRARYPHVDLLVNKRSRDIIRLRHQVIKCLRDFLDEDGFTEVSTPILTPGVGGAVARPFETEGTEFPWTPLRLRIAPELYLKKLLVGYSEPIYEIGQVFRNEGTDGTHNPEFSICEFYEPLATLEDLIQRTENLFRLISRKIHSMEEQLPSISQVPIDFQPEFKRLPFIPTLESAIGHKLPDLSSPSATDELRSLFAELNLPLPATPNLPRLLDALAGEYIEPLCTSPTFIIHHPAVLSPLSKSFLCPTTNQYVAARVELFINSREYVNAYEEENDPREQRRKFEEQLRFKEEGTEGGIDEGYLEALEWGLPPTGGWGMGIDRVVMLFAGVERIGDVLPFGLLRNVVRASQGGERKM
ncbi:lysyl-tRNA synthetase-like protein [Patellaria atrata CBS 101060]|uniref:Lysyl-tRNA synthetase n=1 Tax=Patellaria atrata CBS 101060 TaxID=1346257 RepID=A0A9P4VT51_9PEZI|nr:lysyl-tRNA synthetase-like protein [Patellaria atrata CBS 101060]